MTGQLIALGGMVLIALAIYGMYWCTCHRSFGTCDGGMPHYTNVLAGALWVPVFIGLVTIAVGVAWFSLEYGP